jgi:hypothetical protein
MPIEINSFEKYPYLDGWESDRKVVSVDFTPEGGEHEQTGFHVVWHGSDNLQFYIMLAGNKFYESRDTDNAQPPESRYITSAQLLLMIEALQRVYREYMERMGE